MAVRLCCMQQCDQLSYAQAITRLLEPSLVDVTFFAVTMQEQRQTIAGNSSVPMSLLFTSWHLLLHFSTGTLRPFVQDGKTRV